MGVSNGTNHRESSWRFYTEPPREVPPEHSVTHFDPSDRRSWQWAKWVAVAVISVFIGGMIAADRLAEYSTKAYVVDKLEDHKTNQLRLERDLQYQKSSIDQTQQLLLLLGSRQDTTDKKLDRLLIIMDKDARPHAVGSSPTFMDDARLLLNKEPDKAP